MKSRAPAKHSLQHQRTDPDTRMRIQSKVIFENGNNEYFIFPASYV